MIPKQTKSEMYISKSTEKIKKVIQPFSTPLKIKMFNLWIIFLQLRETLTLSVLKVFSLLSTGMTPLHKVFQTNNYSLICKCLIGSHQPDLNVLDDEGNTPLAYGSRKMLQMLNLENGVVCVSIASSVRFDNNKLLQREKFDQIKEEEL